MTAKKEAKNRKRAQKKEKQAEKEIASGSIL
jgi:hypothetical protein